MGMDELAVKPTHLPGKAPYGGESVRKILIDAKLAKQKADGIDFEQALAVRKESWRVFENAHKNGKAKYIGVSNYPAELLEEMATWAEIMPAVNQVEFHPRFACPKLIKVAEKLGVRLVGYGSALSMLMEKNPVIQEIAARTGRPPMQVILRWTAQKGVVTIPKSARPKYQAENMESLSGPDLSPADVAAIDAINEDHPYYWLPEATIQTVKVD